MNAIILFTGLAPIRLRVTWQPAEGCCILLKRPEGDLGPMPFQDGSREALMKTYQEALRYFSNKTTGNHTIKEWNEFVYQQYPRSNSVEDYVQQLKLTDKYYLPLKDYLFVAERIANLYTHNKKRNLDLIYLELPIYDTGDSIARQDNTVPEPKKRLTEDYRGDASLNYMFVSLKAVEINFLSYKIEKLTMILIKSTIQGRILSS
jgi:hypothetical protein